MFSFSLLKLPKSVTAYKGHLKCNKNRKFCVSYKHNNGIVTPGTQKMCNYEMEKKKHAKVL